MCLIDHKGLLKVVYVLSLSGYKLPIYLLLKMLIIYFWGVLIIIQVVLHKVIGLELPGFTRRQDSVENKRNGITRTQDWTRREYIKDLDK